MAASPQAFPNALFQYGGDLDITPDENKTLQANMSAFRPFVDAHRHWCSTVRTRKRRLLPRNRLGVDETVLADIEDPREYWTTLLSICPPRPWIDPMDLVKHLVMCRPMDEPSNSSVWRYLRNWLDEAIFRGSSSQWADNTTPSLQPIDEAMWEAVRIIGDASAGFGTFPRLLKAKATAAGMGWFLVHPRIRQIPQCWGRWVIKQKFTYADLTPMSPSENRGRASSVPTDDPGYSSDDDRPLFLTRHARSQRAGSSTAVPSTSGQEHSKIEGTTTPFVEPDAKAAGALQALLEMEISDNEEENIWFDAIAVASPETPDPNIMTLAAKYENLVGVCQRVNTAKSANTHRETARMIKDTFVGGPIDGRIREIMHQTLQRAGIEDNAHLQDTVAGIIRQTNTEYAQRLSDMDDRLKHQETTIANLSARIEALARTQLRPQTSSPTVQKSKRQKRNYYWDDSDDDE